MAAPVPALEAVMGGLCAVPLSAGAPDGRIGNVTSVWEDVVLQSSDGENGGYQGPKKV